ncbi:hypothetical protein QQS21_008672 [Conoideocrella luteorostrata]|uniref:Uncharacterized protein n=1 Tax=Conoideocrella luteorostrata TaxID=1105319 RepID=A0AAJ0FVS2_9HYPO|nr:hypothetical protein QQS21_008672 [Conoideocrella luteorostrata]
MSDSQPVKTDSFQELSIPPPGLYEDDLSEDTVLLVPFEIYNAASGYLSTGGDQDASVDPESTCKEEGETYANLIAHSRVRASLKRPLRLCNFFGAPACLMVLEIQTFDDEHYHRIRRLLRFKSVDVSVEFEDSGGRFKMAPEIVMFCPESFTGKSTEVKHEFSNTFGAGIGMMSGSLVEPVVNMRRQHNTQFIESCNVKVIGRTLRDGDKTTIVKWQVKEDAALRQGVPEQLRFAIAVTYNVERAFKMRFGFTANLGFNDVEFRVKKKATAMSVTIDPGKLKQQVLSDAHGQKHGEAWYCKEDDSELTPTSLEDRTNLRGSTVGYVTKEGFT